MGNNIVVLYHANCLDGFGAAYAAWCKFGADAVYIPVMYDNPPPQEAFDCDTLYLVDFSYKKDVMKSLCNVEETLNRNFVATKDVWVFDHHVTAEAELKELFDNGLIRGCFDMKRSGAVITWEELHPEKEVPWLLRHVQDRDLWKFQLNYTKELIAALWNADRSFLQWHSFCLNPASSSEYLIQKGEAIIQEQNNFVKTFLDKIIPITFEGFKTALINCPPKVQSDLGNLVTSEAHPYELALMYSIIPSKIIFSMRSTAEHVDCSLIAKAFGGGGHKHAAGFTVYDSKFLFDFIKKLGAEYNG